MKLPNTKVKPEHLNTQWKTAITDARPAIVESWLEKELSNANARDLESYRERLKTDEQIEKISNGVAKCWPGGGKRHSSQTVATELRNHPELIEFFIEFALDERLHQLTGPERERREEIERILNVEKRGGDDYDILRIKDEMERPQIPKPSIALNTLEPDIPGFNANAFGPDYSSSEGEEEEEEEDKTEIPDIPEDIKQRHQHMRKHIRPYLSNFEESNPGALQGIQRNNDAIKKLNDQASRPTDAYVVDEKLLFALKKAQSNVVKVRKEEGSAKAEQQFEALRDQYLKTCDNRKNQWPQSWWGDIIEKAVRERLDEIDKTNPDSNKPDHTMGGVEADGNDDNSSIHSLTTPPSVTGDDGARQLVRPIQPIRAGYTLLGDEILGYRPLERYNSYAGEYYTYGMKFFVQLPGSKTFGIFSANEIGLPAALAYDRLPENDKNDVRKYLEQVNNHTMDPGAFEEIVAAGAKESEFEMTDRFPETWVQIAMSNDDNPSKAKIINRTALRSWMRNADKLIDMFYVQNSIVPPWGSTRFPDPRNDTQTSDEISLW
ncbi:dnaJ domain-containing [Fusarium albosuccineum]|uniref:DnaJ domain-containing n=1 Tax=Fusarium albosuccineum TaxID=1237068 RepID=A0A8H4LKZ5_9HYPO|nr:dnaJ domain-containing [Fusarium albosuccineum]